MANGTPSRRTGGTPAGIGTKRKTGAREFDADARREERENTPITIEGVAFRRARKNWQISRIMRQIMRIQETGVALAGRLRARIAELEAEQIEAAASGDDARDQALEVQITALIEKSDDAIEGAERSSYRLLALLLAPPADLEWLPPSGDGDPYDEDAPEQRPMPTGFGIVDDEADAEPAIAFLQEALDIQDAAAMAAELTGSTEPDPPATPSSEVGSS